MPAMTATTPPISPRCSSPLPEINPESRQGGTPSERAVRAEGFMSRRLPLPETTEKHPMHEYELTGSHYEMGRHTAVLLKLNEHSPEPPPEARLQFARACEAVVREHTPWLLDEIRGMASVDGVDPTFVQVL